LERLFEDIRKEVLKHLRSLSLISLILTENLCGLSQEAASRFVILFHEQEPALLILEESVVYPASVTRVCPRCREKVFSSCE
jgi:hypothetical protein